MKPFAFSNVIFLFAFRHSPVVGLYSNWLTVPLMIEGEGRLSKKHKISTFRCFM